MSKQQSSVKLGVQSTLRILGLVGTVGANLTAPFVVVQSLEQLSLSGGWIDGKIVVFDQPWTENLTSLTVVTDGASAAAAAGAVGCLVKSATPFSMATMHVGVVNYRNDVPKIPCASITVEDALNLAMIYESNRVTEIRLQMDAHVSVPTVAYNIIADIEGTSDDHKGEQVVIGAHIDTLDLGHGVQDSLAGFVMAWEGFRNLIVHDMTPARTLRLVGWVGSELGYIGAQEFAGRYGSSTVFAFDADRGTSKILGISATVFNDPGAAEINALGAMMNLLAKSGDIEFTDRQLYSEVDPLRTVGVPVASFITQEGNNEFFWFQNTAADTVATTDATQLRNGAAIMTAYAYCVADLEIMIPKKGQQPESPHHG